MSEVRLGLIGVGPWAERYAATLKLLTGQKARVTAYARKRREDVAWLPGAVRVDHPRAFIEGGLVDAVIVACGPESATRYVEMALGAGLPVLVEKPVTISPRDALRLLALASEGSGEELPWVRVGHVHLFAPAYLKLRALLTARCLANADRIMRIESEGAGYGPWRSYSSLWDYGPHDASMLFDLLAMTEMRDSFEVPLVERLKTDRGERWTFDVRVGTVAARIAVSNASGTKVRRLVVDTVKGHRYVYDDREPHGRKLVVDGSAVDVGDRGALTVMLDDFVNQVAEGGQPVGHLHDLELTAKVTELLKVVETYGALD